MSELYRSSIEAGEASCKIELSVACTNLKDLDHFSKSDPAVFLYSKQGGNWVKLGRTEVVENSLNPKFSTTFNVEYHFEEIQEFQFVVYDIDYKRDVDNVSKQEMIGTVECMLADIMTSGQQLSRTLRLNGEPRGNITIQAEEVQDSKFLVHFELSATKLDKKDLFGKSDPFIEISKVHEGATFTVVYRSKPILKTTSPRWAEFQINMQKLCSGDWERTLQFSVWDWNKSGNHKLIGTSTATLKEICPERGGNIFQLNLVNPAKKKMSSGVLVFNSVKVTPIFSFVDYIRGGCQISLIVAVDFTASNGDPTLPTSLHYNGPCQENEYIQAIRSVASVLASYDSDQMIPAFGFGAQLPPHWEISHCFPLNSDYERPEVHGVQGILDAYMYTLNNVKLHGPTNFSSFLDKTIQYARGKCTQESQNYFVLLIITDGLITDTTNTVDRIVAASKMPLSIVIVGVGIANFGSMEALDADNVSLVDRKGDKMARDIVQFVPFREFTKKMGHHFSLAKETLAEIPSQLVSFMKANNIKPLLPCLQRHQTTTHTDQGGLPSVPEQVKVLYPMALSYPGVPQSSSYSPSAPQPSAPQPSAPQPSAPQPSAPYHCGL